MKASTLFKHLRRASIFTRIAVANLLFIILGMLAGVLLSHVLTNTATSVWIISTFIAIAVLLIVAHNFLVIRAALRPLYELRQVVDRIQAGQAGIENLVRKNTDPDIHQLAIALNSLISQLEDNNRQLRALSKQAINAQEEERKSIARSLHDDTGQALSMLIINLERLENRFKEEDPELASRLGNARQLASHTLDNLRKIIYGLRPAILDDLGLIPAIRWYAHTNLDEAGIQFHLEAPAATPPLPASLTITLFRVTQEAVNNIVRHSHANQALIRLSFPENEVYLHIEDDGRGFDAAETPGEAIRLQHWGLAGIQERVDLVGGLVNLTSEPGKGTMIDIHIPVRLTDSQTSLLEDTSG